MKKTGLCLIYLASTAALALGPGYRVSPGDQGGAGGEVIERNRIERPDPDEQARKREAERRQQEAAQAQEAAARAAAAQAEAARQEAARNEAAAQVERQKQETAKREAAERAEKAKNEAERRERQRREVARENAKADRLAEERAATLRYERAVDAHDRARNGGTPAQVGKAFKAMIDAKNELERVLSKPDPQ